MDHVATFHCNLRIERIQKRFILFLLFNYHKFSEYEFFEFIFF